MQRPWFVYLLECRNGHIYTGVTPDLERRIAAHVGGKGAKYTRGNPPRRLLACKSFADKTTAMQTEIAIKRMPRVKKLGLAESWSREHAPNRFYSGELPHAANA